MILSVIIPAHNEAGCIEPTIRALNGALRGAQIPHEIVAVNDSSKDDTLQILENLAREISELKVVTNTPPNGFGLAVRKGLSAATGDALAIYMADASDSPQDLIKFYRLMVEKKLDCVFGTRFSKQSNIVDYPTFKLVLNRFINFFIRVLFNIRYNDVTNAFKLYHRNVIEGCQPLLSKHFNLTVEIPLKSIIRGYRYGVVPNDWHNRKTGESKLKIKEMGSRYLFIILYCWLEKWLSRGDYRRATAG